MAFPRNLLLATTLIAGLTGPSLAFAQQTVPQTTTTPAPTDTTAPEAATAEAPKAVKEVVVTGSRIKRSEFNSSAPIQVISSERSALQGLADTASVLQQSSLASNSFQVNNQLTGFVTTGGPGAQTISLRGLGAQRTLVLLNGRRVGPAGVGGTVGPIDLNIIPQSMVERVEILKDGASSIYGSDAVAGVVNIITKNKMDGFSVDVYGNKSFDGGGDKYRINGSWGKTFDRGYVSVGADYTEQKPLRVGDRDDTACAADYLFDPDTHKRVDFTDYFTGKPKCYNLVNNIVSTGGRRFQYAKPGVVYDPASIAVPANVAAAGDFRREEIAGNAASYSYANFDSPYFNRATVISPTKLYSVSANGAYDLTSSVQLYGDLLLNRRESYQDSVRQLFPTLSASNPNNPFGAAAQPIIAIPYQFSQKVDYVRAVGGARGSFGENLGFLNGWDWDVYGAWSHSKADYYKDEVYNDRVLATTGASACDDTTNNLSGFSCSDLPAGGIPWISRRVLAGDFTPEERAFLFTRGHNTTTYDQKLVEASLSGDLFTLPAGKVGGAVGVSWRRDALDDQPDQLSRDYNIWGLTSAGVTKGTGTTKEAFAEVDVPLLKDVPLVQSLDLQASTRYTHDSSYGGNSTYKVGLNWKIIPSVRIRATTGTSFRAPSLYEQYLGSQTGFLSQTSIDPCIEWGTSSDPNLTANCAAAGLAPGYTPTASSATVFSGGGAATGDLQPETSKARTIGLVWTPSFVDLSVAVDYADIEVSNEITRFGAGNILSQCYSKPQPNFYCTLFTRDTSGSPDPAAPDYNPGYGGITQVFDNYMNIASQRNRSIDLTTRYRHDFGDLGKLTFETQFTWMLEDVTKLDATGASSDYLGSTFGFRGPDFSGQTNLTWQRGDWTGLWSVQMIGKGSDTELFGGDVFNSSRYGQAVYYKQNTEFTTYHSVSLRKKFNDWSVMAGIQNLFDERPPAQSSGQFRRGTAAIGNYDMIGRRVFVSLSKKW